MLHLHTAKLLFLGQGNEPAFYKRAKGSRGGPGQIAQFLHGSCSHRGQKLHHSIPEGGSLLLGRDNSHCLLYRDGQTCNLAGLVAHCPGSPRFQGEGSLFGQGLQCRHGVPASKCRPDLPQLGGTLIGIENVQNKLAPLGFSGRVVRFFPIHAFAYSIVVPDDKVQSGGEHSPGGIIHRAEPTFPHPDRKFEKLRRQNGDTVQRGQYRFQSGAALPFFQGQDDAFTSLIPRTKGDQNPHAGLQKALHIGRNLIVIGLINGIGGRRKSNFCQQNMVHLLAPFAVKRQVKSLSLAFLSMVTPEFRLQICPRQPHG